MKSCSLENARSLKLEHYGGMISYRIGEFNFKGCLKLANYKKLGIT